MVNTYTINTAELESRVLDRTSSFPPTSKYNLIITPDPGETIQAAQYSGNGMVFSYEGDANSHTKWPSRFQWTMPGLGESDITLSGLKEFPTFYKIVFEDSTNPTNDINWVASKDNKVYVWIYFGKNETAYARDLTDTDVVITYSSTLIVQNEVIDPIITTADNNINSFNF